MEAKTCAKCGGEFTEWVEFCPHCSEPVEGYARPAGFWIGVGAYLIDTLVFIPLIALVLFSSPEFQSATSMQDLAQVKPEPFLQAVGMLANVLLLADCVTAAFTRRKRALHDMLADSYCVYKGPQG